MSGPMLWLQNCLNRTAKDREEDGDSNSYRTYRCCSIHETLTLLAEMVVAHSPGFSAAVPLFPVTEANEAAMEHKRFQKLLRKLGMRPPANEQVCACVWYFNKSFHIILI